MTDLSTIVSLLDSTLRTGEIKDASGAMNGLQVENNGCITRVATAVDASQRTLDAAVAAGADLLIVHHGLFWCGMQAVTGWWKKKLMTCLDAGLAVYSSHLPLDLHPELGNNACIAAGLGLQQVRPEVNCGGTLIGMAGMYPGTVGELKEAYARLTGAEITGSIIDAAAPAGEVAVCSGAGGAEIYQLYAKGFRTYLTGEENHWVTNTAQDMGMNVMFAGHYATETFGVKALGQLLNRTFGLPTVFIDNPTGM